MLVYRTDKYKKLKAEVEKHSKKCKFLVSNLILCNFIKYGIYSIYQDNLSYHYKVCVTLSNLQ